ncbi:MAG: hypothetical protein KF874_11950 [Rhizobiaceae bacterium]|nr:hypothetical protein [Rhizobiaceae bacterium]
MPPPPQVAPLQGPPQVAPVLYPPVPLMAQQIMPVQPQYGTAYSVLDSRPLTEIEEEFPQPVPNFVTESDLDALYPSQSISMQILSLMNDGQSDMNQFLAPQPTVPQAEFQQPYALIPDQPLRYTVNNARSHIAPELAPQRQQQVQHQQVQQVQETFQQNPFTQTHSVLRKIDYIWSGTHPYTQAIPVSWADEARTADLNAARTRTGGRQKPKPSISELMAREHLKPHELARLEKAHLKEYADWLRGSFETKEQRRLAKNLNDIYLPRLFYDLDPRRFPAPGQAFNQQYGAWRREYGDYLKRGGEPLVANLGYGWGTFL